LAPPLRDKLFACTEVDRAPYERVREEFLTRAADIHRRQGPHIIAYRRANHEMQTHMFPSKDWFCATSA
jgi:hypothetical protein